MRCSVIRDTVEIRYRKDFTQITRHVDISRVGSCEQLNRQIEYSLEETLAIALGK